MRYQQSWSDLDENLITSISQENLKATLASAYSKGLNHVETARHYGTSELQLGFAMKEILNPENILQTKVPPNSDPKLFESELKTSFENLKCDRLDLLAIHGINLPEHLDQTLRSGGCMDVVRSWQAKGLIGSVGFSTHGPTNLIVQAIETDAFDYVNLHWYFIRQDNGPALDAALEKDLGVFIISPTDKGGHLHSPSTELIELCYPLHPIIFNDLFCLSDPRVHTISVGASNPKDLDLHLKAVSLLGNSSELVQKTRGKLMDKACSVLGADWLSSWHQGLPTWDMTPGEINLHVLLWLYNLVEAWGMHDFAAARYNLLGQGGHWFPGNNANLLDDEISEYSLIQVLSNSPWRKQIPDILRGLRESLSGSQQKRLSNI